MKLDQMAMGQGPVAIAVSGGADSFSLLHAVWQMGGRVLALTVDHGLRPEAKVEAETVANWCRERTIPHQILTWERSKTPDTGLQQDARQARYRLLIEACQREGIDRLLTGHTLDDQAETVFMRLRRGSGEGLAAMAVETPIAIGAEPPIRLGRPMLNSTRRNETLNYAREHDLPFVSDPSNEEDRFERVRMRALLAALEQQDLLSPAALQRTAASVRRLVSGSGQRAREDFDRADGCVLPTGSILLNNLSALEDPKPLMSRLVRAVGGQNTVRDDFVEKVMGLDGRMVGAGVEIERMDKGVLIRREVAAVLGRKDGYKGLQDETDLSGNIYWDQRFIVDCSDEIPRGAALRPLGRLIPEEIVISTPARRDIATLPFIQADNRVWALPTGLRSEIELALKGWKNAEEFLTPVESFKIFSMFEERFTGTVIRY